jgi:hypothetical protein
MSTASQEDKDAMINSVAATIQDKDINLHAWLEVRPFSEFPEALKRATMQFVDRKVVLDMSR